MILLVLLCAEKGTGKLVETDVIDVPLSVSKITEY